MSRTTMIQKVKVLSPKTSDDAISVYLDMSVQAILNKLYPFSGSEGYYETDGLPKKYESLAVRICIYLIRKEGAEGQTAHIENGVHRTYESADIPQSMLNEVIPMVKVPGGNESDDRSESE